MNARARLQQVRTRPGRQDPKELDEIWAALRTVRVEEILGDWSGQVIDTGHGAAGWLTTSSWRGKTFSSALDVQPLSGVTTASDASLWMVEFRGEVTATMIYDRIPVLDHFKAADDHTLLGITNGKDVLDRGQHLYFVLERRHRRRVPTTAFPYRG